MKDIELFQIALGISSPWFVKSLELDPVAKMLDIHLDFQKGSKFACPECGAEGRSKDSASARLASRSSSAAPRTLCNGPRISWLMAARNIDMVCSTCQRYTVSRNADRWYVSFLVKFSEPIRRSATKRARAAGSVGVIGRAHV